MTEIEDAVARMEGVTLPHLDRRRSGSAAARLDAKAIRTILTALERAERERDEALREMGRYAAEAGEAKGRLEMSEAAGIVDMWREHAQSAEAALAALKAEVVEVVGAFAEAAENAEPADLDHDNLWETPEAMMLTYGNLRAARALLAALIRAEMEKVNERVL